jgi:hypothetical protein
MDKRLTPKEEEMLMDTLEKMKEMNRRMEAKEEERRWARLELPITLKGSLGKLTKTDLSAMRINWAIQGASSLRKQELSEVLERQIPALLPDFLSLLDEFRYGILKKIAVQGGHAPISLEPAQLNYFWNRGLLFPGSVNGKKIVAMPQEVLAAFKEWDTSARRETVRQNTEWITLTQGMLYYYGTLSMKELDNLLQPYTGTSLDNLDPYLVLDEAAAFYGEIRFEKTMHISQSRVFDYSRVKKEHELRPDLSFYPFTKSQLLAAGKPDFVDRNSSYRTFVDFIRENYTIARDEADSLVEECVYAIQIGESPGDILRFLQSQLEIDELELIEAFMDHIALLHNNTKEWFLKGYSPNELSMARNRNNTVRLPTGRGEVIDFASGKKVGRNDPCPCGSGKKFKKCCGHMGAGMDS